MHFPMLQQVPHALADTQKKLADAMAADIGSRHAHEWARRNMISSASGRRSLSDISAISRALLIVLEVKHMSCEGGRWGLGWSRGLQIVWLIFVRNQEKLARERPEEPDQVRHSARRGRGSARATGSST